MDSRPSKAMWSRPRGESLTRDVGTPAPYLIAPTVKPAAVRAEGRCGGSAEPAPRRVSNAGCGHAGALFDRADGESGDESVEKQIVEHGDGQARDQARGHQRSPEEHV